MLRFRLWTLFVLLLVAALAVWLALLWQRRHWATISALHPTSSDAVLFEHTVLTEKLDDEYVATVHLQRRGCDDLWNALRQRHREVHPNVFIRSTNDLYHVVQLDSSSKRDLDRAIIWWQAEDQVQAGQLVINGVIVDSQGLPVCDCYVDLIGPDPLIGQYRSRDDGTFTMPMPSRVGNYYLRIRRMDTGREARTPQFAIDRNSKERTVRIQVPFEAPPLQLGSVY
jgi:hypothetical protein